MNAWNRTLLVVAIAGAVPLDAAEESREPALVDGALTRLPVKEVTVFKDGHAFVLHEGTAATVADGTVVLDHLPAPVMGTFWPYVGEGKAKLAATVAGSHTVMTRRRAVSVRELIEANVGADVVVTEGSGSYGARIVAAPPRPTEEETQPGRAAAPRPGSDLVLLQIHEGTRAIPISRIQDITFRNPPREFREEEERRDLLTLRLDWGGEPAAKEVTAGLLYLQKGIRWIPSYRVEIDGEGTAVLKLQATVLNEMVDLEGVTLNLVIGVPSFAFKETLDPIALGQTAARLSSYFQENARTAYALSNAIMTQHARMGEYRATSPPPAGEPDLGPDLPVSAKEEDLFVFTVADISLKKGERMVVPVATFSLEYRDVYTLEVPAVPPVEVRRNLDNRQQEELAKLFLAPKILHAIRLSNASAYPLTTAPALILRAGRLLGQGMMTYTSRGGTCDLAITTAVDLRVKVSDRETARTPNAERWQNETYARIDLAGSIAIANHLDRDVEIEISRSVIGLMDTADGGGTITQLSVFDSAVERPFWWSWYSWPFWWHHFNGLGRADWKVTLEPEGKVDLAYTWHYFWR